MKKAKSNLIRCQTLLILDDFDAPFASKLYKPSDYLPSPPIESGPTFHPFRIGHYNTRPENSTIVLILNNSA